MQTWTLQISVSVDDSWIADGFDMKERLTDVEEHITGMLPYAYGHEIKVKAKILTAPDPDKIKELKGY